MPYKDPDLVKDLFEIVFAILRPGVERGMNVVFLDKGFILHADSFAFTETQAVLRFVRTPHGDE